MNQIKAFGKSFTLDSITVGMVLAIARAIDATPKDLFNADGKPNLDKVSPLTLSAYADAVCAIAGLSRDEVEAMPAHEFLLGVAELIADSNLVSVITEYLNAKIAPAAEKLQEAVKKNFG